MDQTALAELTEIIDNYNYSHEETITPQSLHEKLWGGLNRLRSDPNKTTIIEGWKYKTEFLSTDDNTIPTFEHLPWEQSYVMQFWMSIYH